MARRGRDHRRNRFLVDGTYSCEGDRQTDPPKGVFGGWDGLVASCRKNPDTAREEILPAKVTGIPFAAGEFIEFREPNAAGYGDPLERPPDAVREDVLDDFTTIELAREAYGVVFADERTLEIDEAATEARRAELRAGGDLGSLGEYFSDRPLPSVEPADLVRGQPRARHKRPRPPHGGEAVPGGGPSGSARASSSGELQPGARLPNEVDARERLRRQPATVREALRAARRAEPDPHSKGAGGGSYVTVPSADRLSESLRSSIGLLADADDVTLEELLEARELLEVPAARARRARRSEAELERLREAIPDEPLRLGTQEQFVYNRTSTGRDRGARGNQLLTIAAQPVFAVLQTHLARSRLGRKFHRAINDHHRGSRPRSRPATPTRRRARCTTTSSSCAPTTSGPGATARRVSVSFGIQGSGQRVGGCPGSRPLPRARAVRPRSSATTRSGPATTSRTATRSSTSSSRSRRSPR